MLARYVPVKPSPVIRTGRQAMGDERAAVFQIFETDFCAHARTCPVERRHAQRLAERVRCDEHARMGVAGAGGAERQRLAEALAVERNPVVHHLAALRAQAHVDVFGVVGERAFNEHAHRVGAAHIPAQETEDRNGVDGERGHGQNRLRHLERRRCGAGLVVARRVAYLACRRPDTMPLPPLGHQISTILRHDRKTTTYKLALVRALNDVVTGYPDATEVGADVAVPLRALAERWVAYFWPFCDPVAPVLQGRPSVRDGAVRADVGFRPALERLRAAWESGGAPVRPSDGFFLTDALRIPRRRSTFPPSLLDAFAAAQRAVLVALEDPIQYAGPGGAYSLFTRPARFDTLGPNVVALPGVLPSERCLVVPAQLWATFDVLSLWVEALCIHEWALLTEAFNNDAAGTGRGAAFAALTARPDNRLSLLWERNRIDLLMMEGRAFACPWTGKVLTSSSAYDIDHLVPLAVYPVNDLWNLAPADREFQQHVKRDRLPSAARIEMARPHLSTTYGHYLTSGDLGGLLRQGVGLRFAGADPERPADIADAALRFIAHVAATRNVATF